MSRDRIELTGLRLVIPVGVCPEEHQRSQPVELDVVIETDMSVSGRTDDLANTVDYGAVLADVERLLTAEHHELLERAATVVADHLLADPRIEAVEVCLRKLRPPVPQDVAHTAVRIRRQRSGALPVGMHRAYIALGSNLGDRLAYLRLAIELFGSQVVARSRVFETDPVGGPQDQGAYLNMTLALDTTLDPYALLRRCNQIEAAAGRIRSERDAPRTLDVDILVYEGVTIASEHLTVPHPRMHQRRFMLQPLADVAPHLLAPDWESHVDPGGVWPTELEL